jgi:hypothetical protein
MLRRVALVRNDVSEERIASIVSVTRIDELGTTLAVTNNRRTLRKDTLVTLMMEAIQFSETSVLKRAARSKIQEHVSLQKRPSFRNAVIFHLVRISDDVQSPLTQ